MKQPMLNRKSLGKKSLKLEKRIVSGMKNVMLCVLLWKVLLQFLLKLSFYLASFVLKKVKTSKGSWAIKSG